jgi:hypothetical protein
LLLLAANLGSLQVRGVPMANATDERAERVGQRNATKDIASFPMVYAAVVGAPSLIAIIQTVFDGWRLTPAFQWIIDGYSFVTAQLASYSEPYMLCAITGVNTRLGWNLVLDPIWWPFFLLFFILPIASARGILSTRDYSLRFRLTMATTIALLVPVLLVFAIEMSSTASKLELSVKRTVHLVVAANVFFCALGFLAANPVSRRIGLYIMGGFITAGMIVTADQVLKWLGLFG